MANVRMKIAAGATVLGMGGLAGYALGSNDGQPAEPAAASTPTATRPKPIVHTQVVHRTKHVRAKGSAGDMTSGASSSGVAAAPAAAPSTSYSAPAPAPAPAPAATPVSNPTPPPASTHTSGGGSGSGSSYGDDGSEQEHESEGGGDD